MEQERIATPHSDQRSENDNYDHVLKYTSVFGGVQGLIILIGLVRNKFMPSCWVLAVWALTPC